MTGTPAPDVKCRGCGRLMEPGAALRVTPEDGRPAFFIHRPSIKLRCLRFAGRAQIGVADRDAADAFDRQAATTTPALEASR